MNDVCKYSQFVMPIKMPHRATPVTIRHTETFHLLPTGKVTSVKQKQKRLWLICVELNKVFSWCDATLSSLRALSLTWARLWWNPVLWDIFRDPLKINHDWARPHETLSNSHWLLSAVQAVKWRLAMGSWTTLNNQSEGTTASHCVPDLPLHYTQTIIQVDTSDT